MFENPDRTRAWSRTLPSPPRFSGSQSGQSCLPHEELCAYRTTMPSLLVDASPVIHKAISVERAVFQGGFYKHCGFWRRRRRCPGR